MWRWWPHITGLVGWSSDLKCDCHVHVQRGELVADLQVTLAFLFSFGNVVVEVTFELFDVTKDDGLSFSQHTALTES